MLIVHTPSGLAACMVLDAGGAHRYVLPAPPRRGRGPSRWGRVLSGLDSCCAGRATCHCCSLRIRQARVSPRRMAKATAEAKVSINERPSPRARTRRPTCSSCSPHQVRTMTCSLGPHPNRDEWVRVCSLPFEPGLSNGLHDGTLPPKLFPQRGDAVGVIPAFS